MKVLIHFILLLIAMPHLIRSRPLKVVAFIINIRVINGSIFVKFGSSIMLLEPFNSTNMAAVRIYGVGTELVLLHT